MIVFFNTIHPVKKNKKCQKWWEKNREARYPNLKEL